MSERHPPIDPPSEDESWEMRVEELARRLRYPPTPDIAGKVRVQLDRPHARRLPLLIRAAAVIGVTLLLAALLIPDLRSRALEFLQLGAVRFVEPAGTPVTTIAPPPRSVPGCCPCPAKPRSTRRARWRHSRSACQPTRPISARQIASSPRKARSIPSCWSGCNRTILARCALACTRSDPATPRSKSRRPS